MLSTNASLASLHADQPSPQTPRFGKSKFRTVLGFGGDRGRTKASTPLSFDDDEDHPVLITTQSVHALPSSSTNLPTPSPRSSFEVEEMKIDLSVAHPYANGQKRVGVPRSSSRPNFKFTAAQWGPWTVSVAETPGDERVYNVYIKSEWL